MQQLPLEIRLIIFKLAVRNARREHVRKVKHVLEATLQFPSKRHRRRVLQAQAGGWSHSENDSIIDPPPVYLLTPLGFFCWTGTWSFFTAWNECPRPNNSLVMARMFIQEEMFWSVTRRRRHPGGMSAAVMYGSWWSSSFE
jgi:hypothetical protein